MILGKFFLFITSNLMYVQHTLTLYMLFNNNNFVVTQEWRRRISEQESAVSSLEASLLALMSRKRVLALRHRLRTRAFSHVAELAHRSSTEAMDQVTIQYIFHALGNTKVCAPHFMVSCHIVMALGV